MYVCIKYNIFVYTYVLVVVLVLCKLLSYFAYIFTILYCMQHSFCDFFCCFIKILYFLKFRFSLLTWLVLFFSLFPFPLVKTCIYNILQAIFLFFLIFFLLLQDFVIFFNFEFSFLYSRSQKVI